MPSRSIVCVPVHSYFVTTDADPTPVLVTNRLTGTLTVDATEVAVWAATRPLYFLPATGMRNLPPDQCRPVAEQAGCDALLAERVVLGGDPESLGLERVADLSPRDFKAFRATFASAPVTTTVIMGHA